MSETLTIQITFFSLCVISSIVFLIFYLRNINEEVNYAKYIKIIQKEKEANLKYLEVGNKKINKIESAILEHKKVLSKPLFNKK